MIARVFFLLLKFEILPLPLCLSVNSEKFVRDSRQLLRERTVFNTLFYIKLARYCLGDGHPETNSIENIIILSYK